MGNWEIKKIIHPVSFFLVVIVFIVKSSKKIKITILDILFFGYFLILFTVMFFNINNLESAYIVFREVYFLFILVFIFSQVEIRQEQWNNVLNLIFYLLILNSFFILLTNYLGPEKYMKMITGRYQWGIDPEYKFKISNFYKFWRSPALIGDAASVGYFGVIGYLLMDQNKKFKNKKYIALFPLIFSFVRSAYVVFFIYEFLKFFTKKKNLKSLVLIFKIGAPLLLIFGFVLSKYDILSLDSLKDRFYLWGNKTEIDYNPFFGGAIGNIGGGARGQGFISVIDSYWLFLLFSSGLIGVSLTILFVYEKSIKTNKFIFILISFLFAGFFVSLTQSLVFLALFPLLFIRLKKETLIR
tara:strand:+ start:1106 stop:2170 length:1065 start_codon:yes stop_codon:yes gene_type:complete